MLSSEYHRCWKLLLQNLCRRRTNMLLQKSAWSVQNGRAVHEIPQTKNLQLRKFIESNTICSVKLKWGCFFRFVQYQDYKNHKNPDLPWLDWHYRPMITYDSTDVNYFHHQLKRRVPGVGDVYYHDLHEDLHQHKWNPKDEKCH